jgi:hypothetical protein
MTRLEERLRSGLRDAGELIPESMGAIASTGEGRRNRRGIATSLIALIAVLAVFTPLLFLIGQGREDSSATETSSQENGAILFPVTLGVDQLWPESPSNLSPTALAVEFLNETLGWTLVASEEAPISEYLHSAGERWLRLNQSGIHEPADILLTPASGGGLVITEVGIPWAVGVDASALDSGGTRVRLLRIADSAKGEVTMRLSDGRQVVGSTTPDLTSSSPVEVVFPDADPALVRSILIRYVNDEGTVIALNGASGLDLASEPAKVEF